MAKYKSGVLSIPRWIGASDLPPPPADMCPLGAAHTHEKKLHASKKNQAPYPVTFVHAPNPMLPSLFQ